MIFAIAYSRFSFFFKAEVGYHSQEQKVISFLQA